MTEAVQGASESSGDVDRVDRVDEVDRIVAAWQRERPDLDLAPLEVLSRVSRLARHLDRFRRTAFAEHDLETWEFDVLAALRPVAVSETRTPRPSSGSGSRITIDRACNRSIRLVMVPLATRVSAANCPGERR